jgi:hypothetical protein
MPFSRHCISFSKSINFMTYGWIVEYKCEITPIKIFPANVDSFYLWVVAFKVSPLSLPISLFFIAFLNCIPGFTINASQFSYLERGFS